MRTSTSSVRCADGTHIVYRVHGLNGAGKRVALVHSLAMDHKFWNPFAERLSDGAAVLTFDLGACDVRAALPRIRVPTRILVGEEDYATPVSMAEALHAGIAGSSMAVLPRARHLTPLEVPDWVAAELKTLLTEDARQ